MSPSARHKYDHWNIERHDEDLLHGSVGKDRFRELSTVLAKILLAKRQLLKLEDHLFSLTHLIMEEANGQEGAGEGAHGANASVSIADSADDVDVKDGKNKDDVDVGNGYVISALDEEGIDHQHKSVGGSSRRESKQHTVSTENTAHSHEIAKVKTEISMKLDDLQDLNKQMCLVCSNLEMVHRASVPVLHAVFNEYGLTVLPLLVKVMETVTSPNYSLSDETLSEVEVAAIGNVIKVLSYFSQSEETRYPIVNQKGMLQSLIRIVSGDGINKSDFGIAPEVPFCENDEDCKAEATSHQTNIYPDKTRLHLIGLIANLTCKEENPEIILANEQFMPAIIRVAKEDPMEQVRQYALVAIANIANTSRAASYLAGISGLTELLCESVDDANDITKMYAINILAQLCTHESNILELATYLDGAVMALLISAMANKESCNDETRTQAGSALVKLARHVSPSFSKENADKLDILAHSAVSDHNASIRVKATEILKEFSQYLPPCSELLDALVLATKTEDPGSRCTIAEALQHQSKVGNRKAMAEHNGVLNALVELATIDDDDYDSCSVQTRDAAIGAINGLASKAANRPILAKQQKLMIALVKAVSRENENIRLSISSSRSGLGPPSPLTMDDSNGDRGIKWTKTKRSLLSLVEKM